MQGTWVPSLIQEDPTCLGAAKQQLCATTVEPVCQTLAAVTTEPTCRTTEALCVLEPTSATGEATSTRSLLTASRE